MVLIFDVNFALYFGLSRDHPVNINLLEFGLNYKLNYYGSIRFLKGF